LLDDHPAVQRGLELFVEDLAVSDGAFGQDPDRRDVGQRLSQGKIDRGKRAGVAVKQVQRPDRLPAQPQW
jgi:hypothetical protein